VDPRGNYGATLDVRLAAADTVFFFDTPRWLAVTGVLRRWARHHGEAIHAEGCPEHVSLQFLTWVWRFRRTTRPRVLEQLRAHAGDAAVVVIRSRRDAVAALNAAGGA
jgi:adenylate kinase family enzyme